MGTEMQITAFEIEDCELNVGPVALGADWCLAIEGDGHDFEITHVFIDGKRADEWEASLAKRWFDGDLATGKLSRVRKAYEAALPDDGESYAYEAPRDHRSIWSAA